MSTYTPTPGSHVARIIDWLQRNDEGQLFPSAIIAEALGIEPGNIHGLLNIATRHGLVEKGEIVSPEGKRLITYGIGTGTPPPRPDDEEPDAPIPPADRPASIPPSTPLAAALHAAIARGPVEVPEPVTTASPERKKVTIIKRPEPQLDITLHGAGGITLRRGNDSIFLSAAEARSVAQLLESMNEGGWL